MKKVKVAFCLRDMKIGGVESVFIRTLEKLISRKDLDIEFISYVKIKEPLYADWFSKHPEVTVKVLYPCRWLGTDLAHFFLTRLIQHSLRDVYRCFRRKFVNKKYFKDIDVFVDYYNFSFDNELKNIDKPKLVWWHSSVDVFLSGNYIRYMKDYDRLVALTDGFMDEVTEKWPEYKNKLIRIYNPVDILAIKEKADLASVPNDKNYFVCLSRLYADKDINTLIKAFNDFWLKNKKPKVNLYIIGDGSFAVRYKEYAKSLPVKNNVIFTGAMSNPFGYMKNAIANILSSKSEGLPTVLTEASALDVLNISSDCRNGPREILLDGKAGLLFEPGNAEQLSDCLTAVWNGQVDIKTMIKNASKSLKRFDAENVSLQIVDLIKSYK